MYNSKVSLKVCKEYDLNVIKKALTEGFDDLGGLSQFIKPKMNVLIKPDLYCSTDPNQAKTTSPYLISALAELIDELGAKCVIADSPNSELNQTTLDKTYIKTQMLEASNNGHAILNSNDKISIFTNDNGVCAKELYLIDAINSADIIINVGKFRCDNQVGLIGCSQGLFGLVGGKMKKLIQNRCFTLKKYYNFLVDVYETIQDKLILNILDGIVSNESNNLPRILNSIIIGQNPYAVDSVALEIINQSPEDSLILQIANERGVFDNNVERVGDEIEPLIKNDYHYPILKTDGMIKNRTEKSLKRAYNYTQKRAIINPKHCKGCKACTLNCPMNAISMCNNNLGETYAKIDYDKCINCLKCVRNCPYKIIKTKTPIKYKLIETSINRNLKD